LIEDDGFTKSRANPPDLEAPQVALKPFEKTPDHVATMNHNGDTENNISHEHGQSHHCKEDEVLLSDHNKSITSEEDLLRLAGRSTYRTTALILMLGMIVSGAFLGVGLSAAFQSQNEAFDRNAVDIVNKISNAWNDYVNAAGVIHGRCRSREFTRTDFRELYETLTGGGLAFQAAQFDPNITRDQRASYEQEAREFYAQYYPHVNYRGIVGFETENSTNLEPRSQQDFYFPIHYMGTCWCLYLLCLVDFFSICKFVSHSLVIIGMLPSLQLFIWFVAIVQ